MIAIIDYGVGNLFSLRSSLTHLGLKAVVTADAQTICKADRLILPGWGLWRCHGQALGYRSGAGHPGAGGAKSPCWASAWECSYSLKKAMSTVSMQAWALSKARSARWSLT